MLEGSENWTHCIPKGAGVDTGRAGIFDFSHFYDDSV